MQMTICLWMVGTSYVVLLSLFVADLLLRSWCPVTTQSRLPPARKCINNVMSACAVW